MDSPNPAVIVKDLYKSFKLPHERAGGLKNLLVNAKRQKGYEQQQVLTDVSFEIQSGEFFGIVGRNGSGKSTLLKLLAGIYSPNKGHVHINGSLTPFIELGVGFNPELTGRENIFLNGALLGFNRKDMAEMYDDIVEFAEIERFIDQKLKNYSSGMQVRLAFSIAIRARSDILLIDEVLAVGDTAFQQKCFDYFDKLKEEKRTIIFVSHDMDSVKKYCTRALLINQGKIVHIGDPQEIAEAYKEANDQSIDIYTAEANESKHNNLIAELSDAKGVPATRFDFGEAMQVRLSWPKDRPVKNAGVALFTGAGVCVFATNTFIDKTPVPRGNTVNYTVTLTLGEGRYYVIAATFGKTEKEVIDFLGHGPHFSINIQSPKGGEGLVRLPHTWN